MQGSTIQKTDTNNQNLFTFEFSSLSLNKNDIFNYLEYSNKLNL
ncbi:hypothetical protein LEP1GSC008_3640 [Leptospira kirschneri serovar Bulgarica str. Nikolaevo]|uniref:Uncharacterized protein n=2 Tax=Leptospira kirschneri TaxID=29507 RepID=A0A0E2AZ30_9LEPT|nr:hypothetical protein LEP1GSC081_3149 [Leptospira kirschneri str. H1]EMK24270.1 hypothetical protein LEP1GSC008_3640 [Leptospira kirschneri serovar Bulgarica str. Nikolaevo]